MSNPAEYDIERMIITILAQQAGLPAAVHRDMDAAPDKDRIVVKCEPRTAELPGRRPGDNPYRWAASVEVEIILATQESTATINEYSRLIDIALAATPASAVTTLFNSIYGVTDAFFEVQPNDGGTRQQAGSQTREWTRRLRVITS